MSPPSPVRIGANRNLRWQVCYNPYFSSLLQLLLVPSTCNHIPSVYQILQTLRIHGLVGSFYPLGILRYSRNSLHQYILLSKDSQEYHIQISLRHQVADMPQQKQIHLAHCPLNHAIVNSLDKSIYYPNGYAHCTIYPIRHRFFSQSTPCAFHNRNSHPKPASSDPDL